MSTEAWIGVAGLALTLIVALTGGVATLLFGALGYLLHRAITDVDAKVSQQGARQDRFCERLGKMEQQSSAMVTNQLTIADEIRRLRDWPNDGKRQTEPTKRQHA